MCIAIFLFTKIEGVLPSLGEWRSCHVHAHRTKEKYPIKVDVSFTRFLHLISMCFNVGMIVLPAILMIVVYAKIILRRKEQVIRIIPQLVDLRRHDSIVVENERVSHLTAGQNEANSNSATGLSQHLQSNSNSSLKRLTRIACAASAIVIVCWLPDQFYFCLFQLGMVDLRSKLHDGLIILAFFNTCLNPAIYCFSNKQYAGEFETLLCCVYHRERRESVRQQVQSEGT